MGISLWNNHRSVLVCFNWIFVLLNRHIFQMFSIVRACIKSIILWIMKFHSDCYIVSPGWSHSWWRHQMETFSPLLALCAGNSPVSVEFPAQRPVPRSFDVFCDLRLDKRLSKQTWGWWFETPSCSLWRHCNGCLCLWIDADMPSNCYFNQWWSIN